MATGKSGKAAAGARPRKQASAAPLGSAAAAAAAAKAGTTTKAAAVKAKPAARRSPRTTPIVPTPAWRAADVVVGRVAPAARMAGALAVAAAVGLAVRPFLALATVDGHVVGVRAGFLGFLGWLPAVLVVGGAGGLVLLGRLSRLGLAVIGAAGAVSIGSVLHTVWLLQGGRTALDLPVGGQALPGSGYSAGAGLILLLVTGGLLVLALVFVLLGWTGTVMDDGAGFDRRRPAFGTVGLFIGVLASGAVSVSASSSSIAIAPPAVTSQAGLQRVGGLTLAAVVVVCCVLVASLRPWIAAAGGWLGVAVMLAGPAVENALSVHRSPDLHADLGTYSQPILAVLVLGLAVTALLVRAPREAPVKSPRP